MKARNVHGDQYDYSQVDYRGSEHKVILIYYDHGPWAVTPKSHLAGRGCRKCGYVKSRQKKQYSNFYQEGPKSSHKTV